MAMVSEETSIADMDSIIHIEEEHKSESHELKIKHDATLKSELKKLLGSYDFENVKDVD